MQFDVLNKKTFIFLQVTISNYFFIHIFEVKLVKTFYAAFFVQDNVFFKLIAAKCAFSFKDRVWFIK